MFAWRIFCKEKATTGEIALMRRDVNHIITSNAATRDKETGFDFRPHNIWIRLLRLPRLIRREKIEKNWDGKMGRQQ